MKTYLTLFAIFFSMVGLAWAADDKPDGNSKAPGSSALPADQKQDDASLGTLVKTYVGTLTTGSETTGTILTMKDGPVYELKLDEKFAKLAETLNGKTVMVIGALKTHPGVDVKERPIIVVTDLKAAPVTQP